MNQSILFLQRPNAEFAVTLTEIPRVCLSDILFGVKPFTAQRSLYVPYSEHYMYHQFNIQQLYVLPTHCVFMCFVWISEQTAIISLYNIN